MGGARTRALGPAILLSCVLVVQAAVACWSQEATPSAIDTPSFVAVDRLLKEGNAQQAISLLLPLAGKQPAVPGVERRLGKAYYQTRDLPLAIQHLSDALKESPEDWESVQLLAIANFGTGQLQQAAVLLAQVIPHLPEGRADAQHLLGICYLRLQEVEKARGAFAEMFSVPVDSAMAYFLLGKMMVGQHMEELAAPQLQKALELDQSLAMAHFILGEIDLARGEDSAALSEFQNELKVNPSVWLVYWRLGDTYMKLQRYDEAEQALKQALWLNDSFTGGYLMLGEIELQKGEPDLARDFLVRAVKLDPQNEYAHFFLGRAYQKLGRLEEARQEFEIQKTLRDAKHEDSSVSQQAKP